MSPTNHSSKRKTVDSKIFTGTQVQVHKWRCVYCALNENRGTCLSPNKPTDRLRRFINERENLFPHSVFHIFTEHRKGLMWNPKEWLLLVSTECWTRCGTYNDSDSSMPTGSPIDRASPLTSPQWPKRISVEGFPQQFHTGNNSLTTCIPSSGFPSPSWGSAVMASCYHFLFIPNEQRNGFLSATHYDWPDIIKIFGGETARNWGRDSQELLAGCQFLQSPINQLDGHFFGGCGLHLFDQFVNAVCGYFVSIGSGG